MQHNGKRPPHRDWITIGDHRVFLETHDPGMAEKMKFWAEVAVQTCEAADAHQARVLAVYFHETGFFDLFIASTDKKDAELATRINAVFRSIYPNAEHRTIAKIVHPADSRPKDYCHALHLHKRAAVAPLSTTP